MRLRLLTARAALSALAFFVLLSASCASLRYEHARASVFLVETPEYLCSGFHLGDGKAITAAHCVAPNLSVSGVPVGVLKLDERADLALIELPERIRSHFKSLSLCTHRLSPRDEITGYGFPGYMRGEFTAEPGEVHGYAGDRDQQLIARDTVFPGESGGPVIDNLNGCVAGMASQIGKHPTSNKTASIYISAFEILRFLGASK